MNKTLQVFIAVMFLTFIGFKAKACHGLALQNYNVTVGPTGVTVNGSSDPSTCGCGPYWMQVEIACTAAGLTGLPPTAVQNTIDNWAGPGTTYNAHPWYFGLLNVANYTIGNNWPDNCVLEPYTAVFIPFTALCPGQTYFLRSREWLGGSTAVPPAGPWSAVTSFVVPGTYTPLNFNVNAVPANYCAPNSATLSITNVASSACGNTTYSWMPGGSTATNIVVSPAVSTTYSVTVNAPCQTPITKTITVNVGVTPSAAFTGGGGCTNAPLNFNHTGTAGVTHTWSATPAAGVTITTPNISNPVMTFANAGAYTITHVVSNGTCQHTVTSNITITAGPDPAFTVPAPVQCLNGNSFSFNGATPGGTHSYTFNPAAGAPAAGSAANYGPGSFTTPGTYTVFHSVTSGGCTAMTTSVITVNPHPSLTIVPNPAICGNNNGSIIINNTTPAGQTVISFSLNGSAIPSQTVTGLGSGPYTAALTNNFGCVTSSVTNIANTPGVTNLATTFVNPTCGNSNGSITLGAVTGGTGPFTYSVNNGPFSAAPPLTNLPAGSYTITVKDANNCVFTKIVTLVNTPPPTNITFTTQPTACVGNTGVLGITGVTGGTAAYSFSVNGVSTGSVTNNLAAGPKTITVSDANGCTFSITANITTVVGPTAATLGISPAACGNPNGSATVTAVTGGAPAYQYSFNGGPFSGSTINSGMSAGPHNVVIKDINGCTLTVNFNVGNTGSPSSAIATLTNVSCFGGSNGGFSLTTSGGTPGYSYTLTPNNITSGFGVFTGLTAGAYTINVKDALGCVTTVTTTIGQPAALTLSVSPLPTSCNGGNNGTVTATAGGGTGPYQYNINGGPNQASNIFSTNIPAGAYNVTVIDNLGCQLSQTVTVTQPPLMTAVMSVTAANCSSANGSASVTASGGTPIYTYTWSPAGGNGSQTTGVVAGTYTVLIKDTKNCTITAVASVSAIPGGTAVITNTSNVTCFGAANGSLTANMVGNVTAPLTYSWSTTSTNQTAGPLAPGNYTVTVTDNYGCKSTTVGTVTQPSSITVTPSGSPALCFGQASGSASVVASGGTPGYSYLWSPNGATTTVSSGLAAGNYSIQVTDINNCVQVRTITITQPTSVTINTSTITAACGQTNGAVSATATGGTPAYTYTWSTGFVGQSIPAIAAGTYSVLVKDGNGCTYSLAATVPNASGPTIGISSFTIPSCFSYSNGIATTTVSGGTPGPGFPVYTWSNGQNTGTATNLMNGVYTVTLTDAAGCKASASVAISQPPALTINVSGVNPKCFNGTNGTANAGVTGGTPGYTYAWLPAPGAGGNTASPSGMSNGNYNVTVTDSKGCIIQGTVGLTNPPQMLSGYTSTNVTCFNACNGMAAATVTNAVGAVSYYWTGGPAPLTSQNVTNLCNGTYTMLATDQNSCTASSVVTIIQPPALTVSISAIGTPSCFSYTNGFATASPSGGTPGYTYNWSNSQTAATTNSLGAGSYTITVTDTKSCTATAVANITQPAGLSIVATKTNAPCFGGNGIGNVSYSGGTGIPNILWTPNLAVTQNVSIPASATPYTVTLTDANGCSTSTNITITQPTQLTANITTMVPTNCGQANGSASVAAGGGAGGYTYQWSSNPTFTNAGITSVIAQAYTVNVTDVNGCSTSTNVLITNITAPSVSVIATSPVICFGQANGGATITVTGGAGGNTFLWSYLAQTTQNVSNLPNGLHSITVTDLAGCVGGAVVNITQPTQLVTAVGSVTNVSCGGGFNGSAQMLAVGGTTNYTYLWNPSAQTNSILTGVVSGVYSCTVTDANGCPSTKTVNIGQPNPLVITTNTVVQNSCFGNTTGLINTSITGGTPTYTLTWTSSNPTVTPGPNPVATNLPAGNYTLAVIDAQGCTTQNPYTITEPSVLMVQMPTSTTQATCGNSNGTANVVITGGTPAYAYSWNTATPQLTSNATGLPPGNWVLTTTDAKGCMITATVNITAAIQPTATAVSNNIVCWGQGNGSATLTPNGIAPFTYSWSPSGLTSAIANGLNQGVHSATLTDGNGCKTFASVNIIEPQQLVLNSSPTQTLCFGTIAQVYGQASGGIPPYSYTLTNLNTSVTTSSITQGGMNATPTLTTTTQYTVAVTDVNGCVAGPKNILVNVRAPLSTNGATLESCDQLTVALTTTVSGGLGAQSYTYTWSHGATTPTTAVTANYSTANPNIYTVTVTDGCTVPNVSAVFNLSVHPVPNATYTPVKSEGCAPLTVVYQGIGDANTTNSNPFFWTFSGGIEPASPVLNPQIITFPDAGTYSLTLTVTNKFGCKQFIVNPKAAEVWPVPVAGFFPTPQSANLMEPTIQFTNTSTNANSYVWDFGDYGNANTNSAFTMNATHQYSYIGAYQIYLVAINSKGCKDTATTTIDITPDMGIYIPNTFTPDGNGRNDVFFPYGYGISEDKYKMEIFDRWGELIFTSTSFRKGWDGTVKGSETIAQDGVYIYKIMITDLDNNKKNYIGHVTLIKQ